MGHLLSIGLDGGMSHPSARIDLQYYLFGKGWGVVSFRQPVDCAFCLDSNAPTAFSILLLALRDADWHEANRRRGMDPS